MRLEDIRREIDSLDTEIISLFARRAVLVSRAGALKKDEEGVRDPARVEQVIKKIRASAVDSGLDPDIGEKIYRTAIACFIGSELKGFRQKETSMKDGPAVKVYRRDSLPMRPNVPGAEMWAVALEKSMLTYFELEPKTVFPVHSHEAEQITLVLEGELHFSFEGKTVTLGAGDVVAMPSNVEHGATTGNAPCRAVDAWSPPRAGFPTPE